MPELSVTTDRKLLGLLLRLAEIGGFLWARGRLWHKVWDGAGGARLTPFPWFHVLCLFLAAAGLSFSPPSSIGL